MGKDINKMTLAEIKEHQSVNAEIEKAIGCVPVELGEVVQSSGEFTDYRGKYVIVRTYTAGVFAGVLKARRGKEVEMTNARRLWYWDGAASLSQMANDGVKNPSNCKFAQPVNVQLIEAIEILPVTEAARKIIVAVQVWQK
jgi:hypothetical protein